MDSIKLKAKSNLMLEIIVSYDDKTDFVETEDLYLDQGDIIELDIENEDNEIISGQFPSGDMVYGLKKSDFLIIERF